MATGPPPDYRQSPQQEELLAAHAGQSLLRKRFLIETLFAKLKSSMGLEHSRHRWPSNALVHILSCLAVTALAQPKVNISNIAIPKPMPTSPCPS